MRQALPLRERASANKRTHSSGCFGIIGSPFGEDKPAGRHARPGEIDPEPWRRALQCWAEGAAAGNPGQSLSKSS